MTAAIGGQRGRWLRAGGPPYFERSQGACKV